MKAATSPSLRVDPELRRSAESVLQEGETLSGFVEHAIRHSVAYRQSEQAFIERGLRARDQARQTGYYVEASAVVDQLQATLDAHKSGPSLG